jgi:hypothetical protein
MRTRAQRDHNTPHPVGRPCREDVLRVARVLSAQRADGTFTCRDVISTLRAQGTHHMDTTIRMHVSTKMCANAVGPLAGQFQDFERVERGRFRLLGSPEHRS